MKRIKFSDLFLLAAVIIFFASQKNIWSSVLLLLASLYEIYSVIIKLKEERDDAGR